MSVCLVPLETQRKCQGCQPYHKPEQMVNSQNSTKLQGGRDLKTRFSANSKLPVWSTAHCQSGKQIRTRPLKRDRRYLSPGTCESTSVSGRGDSHMNQARSDASRYRKTDAYGATLSMEDIHNSQGITLQPFMTHTSPTMGLLPNSSRSTAISPNSVQELEKHKSNEAIREIFLTLS